MSLLRVLASLPEVDDVAMLKSCMRKQDQACSGPTTTVSAIASLRGPTMCLLAVRRLPSGFLGSNCRREGRLRFSIETQVQIFRYKTYTNLESLSKITASLTGNLSFHPHGTREPFMKLLVVGSKQINKDWLRGVKTLLREGQLSGSEYSPPFRNPKVLYRFHKSLLLAHTLNQVFFLLFI